ncbi:DUF4097 family beta strand repeat-containing protein [Streptacidiphilus sp. P02-A3a]|uniref:DUF4097 family beta strand repeat-containing protein n=1 Tax=Streptacidiphilus sp. P02-A3a TaxID=2704468 RepID=UPI0015F87433|nr:DUF4097 family beta strand repeat-containing protein [Streptacidiphilus sp. P02-A3a]QMU68222.1 DUF4097 domain-containing protein [Streptacidiphilus sp. P02-A3a]
MSGADHPADAAGARRSHRTAWLAVALVSGLLVAALSGADLVNRLMRQTYTGSAVYRNDISALSVDNDDGDITVGTGRAGQVTVGQRLDWNTVRPTVRVERSGGTLTVDVRCDGPLGDLGCHADLTILVPPQTRLTSVSESGAVTVRRLDGPLDLQSASGGIQLDGVGGPVRAVTSSGPIDGGDLRSGQFTARSSSGPVSVDFAAPPGQVSVSTDSGPVEVDLPQATRYRVTGSSGSGPRDVTAALADPTAPGLITADTGSGPVTIDYDQSGG